VKIDPKLPIFERGEAIMVPYFNDGDVEIPETVSSGRKKSLLEFSGRVFNKIDYCYYRTVV